MVNDVGFCFQQRKIAREGAETQRKIFTQRREGAKKKIARRGAEAQRNIHAKTQRRREKDCSQRRRGAKKYSRKEASIVF